MQYRCWWRSIDVGYKYCRNQSYLMVHRLWIIAGFSDIPSVAVFCSPNARSSLISLFNLAPNFQMSPSHFTRIRFEATQISKFFGISEAILLGSQFHVEANPSRFWVRSHGADSHWGLFCILQAAICKQQNFAAKVLHRQSKLMSNLIRDYVWRRRYHY